MATEPPKTIDTPKAIIAEGVDAHRFLIWACQAYGVLDICVYDFGGVTDLRSYLKLFRETPGFDQLDALVVARDAEKNGARAFDSVVNSLRATGFAAPDGPFRFARGAPRTAVMVFPGFLQGARRQAKLAGGMLEDLCLATVADDPLMNCVGDYVDCICKTGEPPGNEKKTRLHAFLAGKAGYAGLKLGQAAQAGAWDWQHPALKPFKDVILAM